MYGVSEVGWDVRLNFESGEDAVYDYDLRHWLKALEGQLGTVVAKKLWRERKNWLVAGDMVRRSRGLRHSNPLRSICS